MKWFDADMGYGFIAKDTGYVVVDHGEIQTNGFRALGPEPRVRFRSNSGVGGGVSYPPVRGMVIVSTFLWGVRVGIR
jgi:cold shock CspA family protein